MIKEYIKLVLNLFALLIYSGKLINFCFKPRLFEKIKIFNDRPSKTELFILYFGVVVICLYSVYYLWNEIK